jgi:chromosome segregation ATPase
MSYEQIDEEYNRTKRRLLELEKKKIEIEKSPQFKDDKIRELEKRIVLLENELRPYREANKQKKIDEYGSMKCSGQIGCYCPVCNGCF